MCFSCQIRISFIPHLSSDRGPIRCKWLSSLTLGANFAEQFRAQSDVPGDLTSIIGERYNPSYTAGALTYSDLINYEAAELVCTGLEKPILFIRNYSKIPTLSGGRRNLVSEQCRTINSMYFQSRVTLQGVYEISTQAAERDYIINRLSVSPESFVSHSVFWED